MATSAFTILSEAHLIFLWTASTALDDQIEGRHSLGVPGAPRGFGDMPEPQDTYTCHRGRFGWQWLVNPGPGDPAHDALLLLAAGRARGRRLRGSRPVLAARLLPCGPGLRTVLLVAISLFLLMWP